MPESLFGRLVLVLLAGLLLAQGLGAWLQLRERGASLYHASGLHVAQRIADTVRLLERVEPAERKRLAGLLNAPGTRVALRSEPLSLPAAAPEDPGALGLAFESLLRRDLGAGRELRVAVLAAPAGEFELAPRGMGHGPGRGRHHPWGMPWHAAEPGADAAFLAQVRLGDGSWLIVQHRVPVGVYGDTARLLLTLGVLLGAVLAVALVAVRWATGPLARLARAAEAFGRDINAPPLEQRGPREVREAARAFNTMQARIARYVEERTRILAAVSHDLRTPVTRLRLRTELLDDAELRVAFERDLQELQAMTDETLAFVRGIDEREPPQPVDLLALAESLAEDAAELGHEVAVEGAARPYPGRSLALKRCVRNLLDNALRYGNGRAGISLEDQPAQLVLRVYDDGPGLPEDQLERAFEPFHRGEPSRSRATGGTGLGLALARDIARAHGGGLTLRNRPRGGLEAVLTLPR